MCLVDGNRPMFSSGQLWADDDDGDNGNRLASYLKHNWQNVGVLLGTPLLNP